jgi:DNA-binding SARP family transcriptional activator/tetratricopeptide (TPR) repeat protein
VPTSQGGAELSAPRDAHFRYRVLGPPEVITAEGAVTVPQGKTRHLLGLLLAHRERAVSVDFLIDCMWKNDPPNSARENLRGYVHRLRKAIGPADRIHTVGGYQLVLNEPDLGHCVDADEFQEQVAQGQRLVAEHEYGAARSSFRTALDLWDFERDCYEGFMGLGIETEKKRLDDLRILAVIGYCTALNETGGLTDEVNLIAAALQSAPLNERLCSYLMQALAECGRRDDALETYQHLRRTLSSELGLSPGRPLTQLHRNLLANGADPTRPPTRNRSWKAPCLLPPDPLGFSGRNQELVWLLSHLQPTHQKPRAPSSQAEYINAPPHQPKHSQVAIYGQGGAGKTALAIRAAHQLRRHYPDGQLFVNTRAMEDSAMKAHAILDMFLRVLGFSEPEIPEDTEARSAIFRSFIAERRVLIVLDNVSDQLDLAALQPPTEFSALLLTSRAPLTLLPNTNQLKLECPDLEEAVEMIRFYAGQRGQDAPVKNLTAVVKFCGLLPLAIRIAGVQLAARPHVTIENLRDRLADSSRTLSVLSLGPMDICSAIDLSVRPLSAQARLLFQLAGALDTPTFTAELAAALLDQPRGIAEDAIDELMDAQLLDAVPRAGRNYYQFHDLIKLRARQLAKESLSASQQIEAVERAIGLQLADAELCQTYLAGRDHLSVHGDALRWQVPDALYGERPREPAEWAEQELDCAIALIDQAAALGLSEPCWDLAVTMAPLLEVTRHFDEWLHSHRVALGAVRTSREPRGEAALLMELGEMQLERQHYDEAAELLTSAGELFEACGEQFGMAMVDEKLGRLAMIGADLDEAQRKLNRSAGVLRNLKRLGNLAIVLRCLGQVYLRRAEYAAAEAHLAEAAQLAQGCGARRLHGQIRYRQGELYLATDRLAEAEDEFQGVLELFRTQAELLGEAYALHGLGRVRADRGDCTGAEQHLRQALRISIELEDKSVEESVRSTLVEVLGARAIDPSAKRVKDRLGIPLHDRSPHGELASLDVQVKLNRGGAK